MLPNNAPTDVVRESYLVRHLLDMAVHPVPEEVLKAGKPMKQKVRSFGKSKLNCEELPSKAKTFCVDPGTEELRLVMLDGVIETVVRDSVGKFHNTWVSTDTEISLLGHIAISGRIVVLKTTDPAGQSDEMPPPSVVGDSEAPIMDTSAPGVVRGKLIHSTEPKYPQDAKRKHESGTVVLAATMEKDGSLSGVTPIASSDTVFDDAAVEAMRQWKFSPFTLKGQPVRVEIQIATDFKLR